MRTRKEVKGNGFFVGSENILYKTEIMLSITQYTHKPGSIENYTKIIKLKLLSFFKYHCSY